MAVRDIDIHIRAHDQATRQFNRATLALGRMKQGLTATRLAALHAGAMLLRMAFQQLGQAIRKYTEFEKNLANVRTMLTADTDKFINQYRVGIQEIAVEFGQGTDVLAKGLYDLLSAGAKAEDGLELLRVAAKAAVGGVTDTATSVDALTSVLNSYGIQGRHAAAVTDLMFTAVRRGKLTYEQLAHGIGNVALNAVNARVMIHELLAAISTITYSGLPAERSFTALRSALAAFQAPSVQAAKIAETYGIKMGAAAMETMGLARAVEQLRRVPPDLLVKMFPRRSSVTILAMLNNMERLVADIKEMKNAAGAAEVAFQKLANTPWFRLQRLQQVFQFMLINIGEALMPLMEDISKWFIENKDSVTEWVKLIAKWAAALGKLLVTVFVTVAKALDKIIAAVGNMLGQKWSLGLPEDFRLPEFPEMHASAKKMSPEQSLALEELTNRRKMLEAILHGEWPMRALVQQAAAAAGTIGVALTPQKLAAFESRFLREAPGREQDWRTRQLRWQADMLEQQKIATAAAERTASATERAADELDDMEGLSDAEIE